MRTDELPQYFGKARCQKILRSAKAQPTAQLGVREIALRSLVRGQDVPGEFDHRLAIGRHGHRMGVADEQPTPGFLLELADVLANGRLAQAETFGGLGEAAGLGDRKEGLKQGGFEHVWLSCFMIRITSEYAIHNYRRPLILGGSLGDDTP